jgi:hypothetical protein
VVELSASGHLFVPAGSRMTRFAEAVAWLWRLGPLLEAPERSAVGVGWHEDADELHDLVRVGRLAGAVVFATRPGAELGPIPSRARRTGVASFGPGRRVIGQFPVLHGGKPAVSSSIGVHAVRDGSWMVFAADPDASWGTLDGFWILPALADFFVDVLERPLVMLPPVGWVRYDDLPGTAYHQLLGRDKTENKVGRRIASLIRLFGDNGSRVNLAIAARALADGEDVAIDQVWPEAVAAIAAGVEQGVIEPVCHGYMHLDTAAWAEGEISPLEFAAVDREEADRRLDVALTWLARSFGATSPTFVAPTWAYGPGLLAALAARDVPAWLPLEPGPLVADGNARETVFSRMDGLFRFDYGPLEGMAAAGFPPSVVIHGSLFDPRGHSLRKLRAAPTTARLVLKRDLFRFPWVSGVRWIGAGELLARCRAHAEIELDGETLVNPGGFDVVLAGPDGRRVVRG